VFVAVAVGVGVVVSHLFLVPSGNLTVCYETKINFHAVIIIHIIHSEL
jgi:hypothetical protein